ncbi:MAG: hypothetical protein K8T89_26070 [Planctomycetes bacterium]|nr:hypothetical protein [Planctomycetota bacterium]
MRAWPIIVSLLFTSSVRANEPTPVRCMDDLLRMNECQLLDLFKASSAGSIPSGYAPGIVISNPGKHSTVAKSKIIQKTVWQGKYFDDCGIMTNRMFGIKFSKGKYQPGTSWIDGLPANTIEYTDTSLIFKPYRDEIREVAPGIHLGIMWKKDNCKPKIQSWFALDTRTGCVSCCGK